MGFPHGHRKTTTLVAGLRLGRMGGLLARTVAEGEEAPPEAPAMARAVESGAAATSLRVTLTSLSIRVRSRPP